MRYASYGEFKEPTHIPDDDPEKQMAKEVAEAEMRRTIREVKRRVESFLSSVGSNIQVDVREGATPMGSSPSDYPELVLVFTDKNDTSEGQRDSKKAMPLTYDLESLRRLEDDVRHLLHLEPKPKKSPLEALF